MTAEEINNALLRQGVSTALANRAMLLAFQTEMRNKRYGDEETLDAYYFFKQGWNARRMI